MMLKLNYFISLLFGKTSQIRLNMYTLVYIIFTEYCICEESGVNEAYLYCLMYIVWYVQDTR